MDSEYFNVPSTSEYGNQPAEEPIAGNMETMKLEVIKSNSRRIFQEYVKFHKQLHFSNRRPESYEVLERKYLREVDRKYESIGKKLDVDANKAVLKKNKDITCNHEEKSLKLQISM